MAQKEKGKVKFIRKKGKIIPIKDTKSRDKKPKEMKVSKPTKRAQVKQKPSPKEQGFRIASTIGVGSLVGAATYVGMRKFRLSNIKKLAELQTAVKESGGKISMATRAAGETPTFSSRVQSAIFGMPVSGRDAPVVFRHQAGVRARGSHVINPEYLHDAFGSKRTFGQMFTQASPKAVPKTYNLDEALKMVGGNPDGLSKLFPGKKFVVKAEDSALSSFNDFTKTDDFIAGNSKARKAIQEAKGSVIQEVMDLQNEYRVHVLNGKAYGMSHRNIPNKTFRNIYNKISTKLGAGAGGGAFIPVMGKERKKLRKFVEEQMDAIRMQDLPQGQSFHAAFDIAKTRDGYKLIEANPSMGTFNNPIINRQFARHATGRWGKDVSGAAALASGGTAAGVTYGVQGGRNDKKAGGRKTRSIQKNRR